MTNPLTFIPTIDVASLSLFSDDAVTIESMTEDRFQATPHRVLGKGNARQSIGFFLEPNLHGSVKPFTTAENEPLSADEDTYAAALLQVFAEREARKKQQDNQDNKKENK